MTRVELPVLALVPGDCTGIGPEQTARILHEGRGRDVARIVVVGDSRVLELGAKQAGVSLNFRRYPSPSAVDWDAPEIPLVDLGNIDPSTLPQGVINPESGRLTGETLARAIDFAKAGEIDGVCFAPLNKQAMFKGGWRFPDEHKMFAHLLEHTGPFSEMNVLEGQWMTRVTSHVSLRTALDQVSFDSICRALRLADETMRKAGIERPRIAVAALNPHAGEGGLFGTEEIDIIRPAVEAMAREGIACDGPWPADTVYLKAFNGTYDSVLAMYHDQGQIATKLKGFNKGVTITAGLEIVFTTPAHGTAFDIVGKGIADIGAFEAALRLAARVASRQIEARAAA
ncbi:4-hydroxythreonine-4-phosphate dehydrogenase [Ancylobacter novellus DSM 506]|uniref:4-hydroxythreonine-4-phosphate dehydrogenase n=1 Tax=Ancylobacter novellus (strain ATCC 8093 / DSM 506 / JCM 20403 / CCM 1077 / IAM 12100 / NBRC 12443 / NCIMB 10456) TaxID=639283 RepID=D7AAA7_ANCN5|nr:4-hydroxythreonine-4-phosphate dehydrogenase PdxA [Ancylobacter novellus]ADH88910.1 4-hydroxythreonine-4-phosphate dehydrogenase [Ancylobacter novellus DSM 506]